MAQHDGVISNASGAAVRADLNNALAALITNSSGATSPGTTYAYQWWADTTTGQLKLRNSSNSAWITIFELDGTMLMEDGSASAPGLAFASDLDTGFAKNGTNGLMIAAGGVQRFSVSATEVNVNDTGASTDFRVESDSNTAMLIVDGSANRVGIGAATPAATLDVAGNQIFTAANPQIQFNAGGPIIKLPAANTLAFLSDSTTERVRIDSSGRLLVGTSNPRENFYQTTNQNWQHQIEGTSYLASGQAQITNSNDALGAYLNFAKSRGTSVGSNTIVNNNDDLGVIDFHGNDGTDFVHAARIVASVDGSPSGNDMPGRITFLTTADAGTSPTERVRIDSKGRMLINDTAAATDDSLLTIKNGSGACEVNIMSSPSHASVLNLGDTGDYNIGRIKYEQSDNSLQFHTNNSEGARLDSSGNFLVGTTSVTNSANVDIQTAIVPATDTYAKLQLRAGTYGYILNGGLKQGEGGRLQFDLNNAGSVSTKMTLNTAGQLGIGTVSPSQLLNISSTGNPCLDITSTNDSYSNIHFSDSSGVAGRIEYQHSDNSMQFRTNATERIRVTGDSNPALHIGKTGYNVNAAGLSMGAAGSLKGLIEVTRDSGTVCQFARLTNDGVLINLRQGSSVEGTISVSGSTVSYNGGHLARWSQLAGGAARTEILRGSVLSNLDEMCEWAYEAQDAVLYTEEDELPEGVSVGDVKTPAVAAGTEDNEQLNRMKVSDVEGDPNVSGVFQAWDDDDDTYDNDFYCAMTGDFVIRIAQGTTVARGDLLMSAGDGTAKPQDDDIVRSKTIAKVTSTTVSTTYADGSYCVPCVLMAC